MFLGSTPPEVRIVLKELLKDYSGDVYVGCSGNFTMDKIFSQIGLKVYSNDVSLYSKLISDILLNRETEIEVTNRELNDVFSLWQPSKYDKLIKVMFALRLGEFAKQKNDYEREFYKNYLEYAKSYHEKVLAKFEKSNPFDFNIQDFYFGDFVRFLTEKKGKGIGVCFAPTYKRGYEKMFKFVEDSFNYERAKYDIWDTKKSGEVFGALLESDENIFYTDKIIPEISKYLSAHVVLKSGKKDVFLYSSLNRDTAIYMNPKKEVASKIKIIPSDYEITENSKIGFFECKKADVLYYKGLFMSQKVDFSDGADLSLAFTLDGLAFGFASFSLRLTKNVEIFMISDFVVNSDIPKLSKLLIMLVKSSDVRRYIASKTKNYYKGVKTSVYTEKPVSMKYRGVFTLRERTKNKMGGGKLVYYQDFTESSIKQIFDEYKRLQSKPCKKTT